MNKLSIPNNEVLTMSSREIAELTGKEHSNVKRDISAMILQLNYPDLKLKECPIFDPSELKGHGISIGTYQHCGNLYDFFTLNKRYTELLITGYSVTLRLKVLDRLAELETSQQPKIPTNFAEALQLAADQEKQLELAAPKVAFVDNFVESSGTKTFRQVSKILKANERLFRAFLSSEGFMYKIGREWTAYQKHIDAGRFSCTVGEKNGHAFTECKFTPKGIEYIAGKWITASSA